MTLLYAPKNNIIHGQARIMGAVTTDSRKPAWILPGGRYTLSEGRAKAVAKAMNEVLCRRAVSY